MPLYKILLNIALLFVFPISAQEPKIKIEFPHREGFFSLEVPTASAHHTLSRLGFKVDELKPVLLGASGEAKFVLVTSDQHRQHLEKIVERQTSVVSYFDRELTQVVDEVATHCFPSFEQQKKIELAAAGELQRLRRLLERLENLSIVPNEVSADQFRLFCEDVHSVNAIIKLGPMRSQSLLHTVGKQTLEPDQQAKLRVYYIQPLMRILRDKGLMTETNQIQQLERAVHDTNFDPFLLRNNYGHQYEFVVDLPEGVLAKVFNPAQLVAVKKLGQTEYRITLSRSRNRPLPRNYATDY